MAVVLQIVVPWYTDAAVRGWVRERMTNDNNRYILANGTAYLIELKNRAQSFKFTSSV